MEILEVPAIKPPVKDLNSLTLRISLDADTEKQWQTLRNRIKSGIAVADAQEARGLIQDLRKIEYPIVSIPAKYVDSIEQEGRIVEHETDIPGVHLIAGTLGRAPYRGTEGSKEGERAYFRILPHVAIEPRFTRDDPAAPTDIQRNKFVGVFVIHPARSLVLGKDVERIEVPTTQ